MADSSLAEYIKANKIKPNRNPGAANKVPKKPGQQKKKAQQNGVKKVQKKKVQNKGQQNGVKKVQKKGQQNGVKKVKQGGIKKAKNAQKGNWRPGAAATVARKFTPFNKPAQAQVQIKTGPGKIQIKNLDFGVSDQDLKDLFSEFGSLKMAAIHYNAQGKSMGVAHLVYARQADAVKAMKQYNGVALDGREMKITLEGQQQVQNKPTMVKRLSRGAAPIRGRGGMRGTFRGRGGFRGQGQKFARGGAKGGRGAFRGQGAKRGQKSNRGQGATRGRGGAKKGRGAKKVAQKPPTKEELDAQLDAYINTKA